MQLSGLMRGRVLPQEDGSKVGVGGGGSGSMIVGE